MECLLVALAFFLSAEEAEGKPASTVEHLSIVLSVDPEGALRTFFLLDFICQAVCWVTVFGITISAKVIILLTLHAVGCFADGAIELSPDARVFGKVWHFEDIRAIRRGTAAILSDLATSLSRLVIVVDIVLNVVLVYLLYTSREWALKYGNLHHALLLKHEIRDAVIVKEMLASFEPDQLESLQVFKGILIVGLLTDLTLIYLSTGLPLSSFLLLLLLHSFCHF